MIRNIQALRGIAACMVFFIHLLVAREGTSLAWLGDRYYWIGPAGVDIFFVISGLIVSMTAARAAAIATTRTEAVVPFMLKRAFRIYPVYWVALAIAFVVSPFVVLAPAWLPAHSALRIVLLATTENDKIMAAWTLSYEVYFYLTLAMILLISPKRVFPMLAIWAIVESVAVVVAGTIDTQLMYNVAFSPLLLEFALGCFAGWLVSRGVARNGALFLAFGLVWFVGGAIVHRHLANWEPWWRAPTFGVASALIAYGLVALEETKSFVFPTWLCRLGDPSYSIYIWHQLVLAGLAALTDELDLFGFVPAAVIFAAWTAIVIAFGFASYRLIERPALEWLNRRLSPRERPAPVPLPSPTTP